jgi:hypothetical protein
VRAKTGNFSEKYRPESFFAIAAFSLDTSVSRGEDEA